MYITQTNGLPFPAFSARSTFRFQPSINKSTIFVQSSIFSQASISKNQSHSKLLDTTGKQQDASGQEGWPPLHFIFLDRLCTIFALFYFLHDRTPSVCTPVGLIRIPRHCRHGELPLRSSSKHVPTVVVLLCISTDLDYDKRIAYS